MPEPCLFEFDCAGKNFGFLMMIDKDDPSDADIIKEFEEQRNYQRDITRIMARALRPGDRAVDGGANVGFYTLLMAQLVGQGGIVFAFEPNPYNVEKIKTNISLNDLAAQIIVYPQPLWAEKTQKTFYACDHNAWGSLLDMPQFGDAKTRPMPKILTATLNEVPGPLRLIKLDVEGAELPALCGAEKHIVNHQCPYIICEVNEFAHKALQTDQYVLSGMMRAHGYDVFLPYRDEDGLDLVPRGAYAHSLDGKAGIFNLLYSTQEAVDALGR